MRFPVSRFQKDLEEEILSGVQGKTREILDFLINDPEINHLQEYANIVSINRLGYNDHGPVHARIVAKNALLILNLLKGKVETSLEKEKLGSFEDSTILILISAFCHDLGMSMGRVSHERNSVILAGPMIERILKKFYDDPNLALIYKSMVFEIIMGHMGNFDVTSIEAGVLLVSDGCDMTKGRARIPYVLQKKPTVGDIHKYSAMSIHRVDINNGDKPNKPVKITVEMDESAGVFQIEEVLLGKVDKSSIKKYIQIVAKLKSGKELLYLG